MATKQLYWTDAHFCGLRSQTNVYGLSKIKTHDGLTKLLAVSINGHFISVEYQKSFDNRLIPITREDIFFSTSPSPGLGETEIVSFDVISQNETNGNTILAISYLKLEASYEEKSPSAFMNIYFLPEREYDVPYPNIMDAISLSHIQYLSLDFIPFKLMHHRIYHLDGSQEICLLLSGNDNKIHVYRQNEEHNSFYEEQEAVEKFFPEFKNISGCVTQMEFRQIDSSHRLTVFGVQSGLVTVSLVNFITKVIEEKWTTEMDCPITSLQLFTQHTCTPCPEFLPYNKKESKAEDTEPQQEPINLLVTSAIDPAAVFCDVIKNGLLDIHILPHSNTQDVVLCSCIIDIDFDGENEVLIGTYGQVLLAYKFVYERPALMTSTPFQSPVPVPLTDTSTPPFTEEKSSGSEQFDKTDHRRRHKSVAALLDNTDSGHKHDKHDRHKSDECFMLEGSLRDGQMARLVRSQENLASPSPRSVYFHTPDHQVSSELTLPRGALADFTDYPGYRLTWTKRFSDPVMGINCDDVMGDGMLNLVVLTLKGLHILQPDMNEVAALVLERLKKLCYPEGEGAEEMKQLEPESVEDR